MNTAFCLEREILPSNTKGKKIIFLPHFLAEKLEMGACGQGPVSMYKLKVLTETQTEFVAAVAEPWPGAAWFCGTCHNSCCGCVFPPLEAVLAMYTALVWGVSCRTGG